MSKIEDGGPAFPHSVAVTPEGDVYTSDYSGGGMTLRDWFAGQALPAAVTMIANGTHSRPDGISGPDFAARTAYDLADAMIRERSSFMADHIPETVESA